MTCKTVVSAVTQQLAGLASSSETDDSDAGKRRDHNGKEEKLGASSFSGLYDLRSFRMPS